MPSPCHAETMDMSGTMNRCEYCESAFASTTPNCPQCGAPHGQARQDYSICPYCKRKLLTLVSFACNYCGKSLPSDLVQVRKELAKTLMEQANLSYHSEPLASRVIDDTSDRSSLLEALGIEFNRDFRITNSLLEKLGIEFRDINSSDASSSDSPVFRRIGR